MCFAIPAQKNVAWFMKCMSDHEFSTITNEESHNMLWTQGQIFYFWIHLINKSVIITIKSVLLLQDRSVINALKTEIEFSSALIYEYQVVVLCSVLVYIVPNVAEFGNSVSEDFPIHGGSAYIFFKC